MIDTMLLATVVAAFSVVQSIFGVGLLVFGTPTLLLLGLPFDAALATLLPASLAISMVQAIDGRSHCGLRPAFFVCSVPAVALGLAAVLSGIIQPRMGMMVGALLVATAATRFSTRVRGALETAIARHFRLCAVATGLVHGLSNLGGGPLTILMSTTNRGREAIRVNIARGYLVFSAIQLAVLAILTPAVFSSSTLMYPAISLATYAIVGHRVFHATSEPMYQRLLTAFTFCFGVLLVARELL